MNSFLKEGERDLGEIWTRIKKRDFSGREGQEIKNSFFATVSSFAAKAGALIFTIILARLLMPELFGLYSIVLSVIVTFLLLSDLGLGESLVKFVSEQLGKGNKGKAKAYAVYFLKIKILWIFIASFAILILARFLAENLLNKPLYLGFVAGALYIIFSGFSHILESLLASTNSFKNIFWKQVLFQVFRIILVPIFIIFAIKYSLSSEIKIFLVMIGLAVSIFLSSLIIYFLSKKKFDFLNFKKKNLAGKDRQKTKEFLFNMPFLALSGLFFGEIDIIILGYFVLAEFVGYYRAAFGLVEGFIGLIAFSFALLPVFSRLGKKQLEKDFEKFFFVILVFSFILTALIFIFAPSIINIIYGEPYLIASNLLRIFSLVVIASPLISLYETYFISRGKAKSISKILVWSTIFDVIITFFLITYFLRYGQIYAVYGAIISSIISRYVVLGALIFSKLRN